MSEALYKNATVPAPNEECRALMLKALEIERNAPPEHANQATLLPDSPPPQFATPEESAPYQPGAEEAAPSAEDLAPPTGPLPSHSPLLRVIPAVLR